MIDISRKLLYEKERMFNKTGLSPLNTCWNLDLMLRRWKFDIKYVGAEIGCFSGGLSEYFATAFKTIYCVDPWDTQSAEDAYADGFPDMAILVKAEEIFDTVKDRFTNIVKIKKHSKEAAKEFKKGQLDFVYIDGLHTEKGVREDIKAWKPKVREGGYILLHDFYGGSPATIIGREMLGTEKDYCGDTTALFQV